MKTPVEKVRQYAAAYSREQITRISSALDRDDEEELTVLLNEGHQIIEHLAGCEIYLYGHPEMLDEWRVFTIFADCPATVRAAAFAAREIFSIVVTSAEEASGWVGGDRSCHVARRQRPQSSPEHRRLVSAANEADDIAVANADTGEAVFDVQQDGKLFVPYGKYPHAKGTQLFDRESAGIMASVFNSMGAKIGRFLNRAGAPIYRGHPDVIGRPDSDPAAPALGWVEGISADEDGANFQVRWNDEGQRAVTQGQFRFYSPHWNCRAVKGGIQPVQLLSIGLTNNPRIPVPAIANDERTAKPMQHPPALAALLGLSEDSDESTVRETIARLKESADKTFDVERQLETANSDLAGASLQLDEMRRTKPAENDAAGRAARAALVAEITGSLVTTGRISIAEADRLNGELSSAANDATASRLCALAAQSPGIKMNSTTGNLATGTKLLKSVANDVGYRRTQRTKAIDAERDRIRSYSSQSESEIYAQAFNTVARNRPELFQ